MSESPVAAVVLEWVRVLAPLAVSLILLARQRRQQRAVAKNGKDIELRPDNQKVLDIVELGITSVEERLLTRLRGFEERLNHCEDSRGVLLEQNDRLTQQNTRLIERIERLLTKRGGP